MTAHLGSPELSDAELVAGVLSADREAFAAVYDRFGSQLYDFAHSMLRQREDAADAVADAFVIVAERLHQLRDPDRLRPWLYAIVRSECLRMLRARKKVAYGDDERFEHMADDALTPDALAEQAALQMIVWEAAAGLADRDRALLDLHLRQGLEGAELGEAMGVSASNAYVVLNRLRGQVDRSLGAMLIARLGREECSELDAVLAGWDGTFSPLVRKRVARHVDDCDLCSERRKKMVAPTALFGAIPPAMVPLTLRDRVVDDIELVAHTTSGPGAAKTWSKPWGLLAAAVVLVVSATSSYLLWPEDDVAEPVAIESTQTPSIAPKPTTTATPTEEPTTAAPVQPGSILVSTLQVDLGTQSSESVVTLSNPGGAPVTAQLSSDTPWLSISPGSTTVDANGSSAVVLRADRDAMREGDARATATVSWSGGSIPISVTIRHERAPSVGRPIIASQPSCVEPVSATVTDESGLAQVVLRWTAPNGTGSAVMAPSGNVWSAEMGPIFSGGSVTVVVEATDRRGNKATGPSIQVQVDPCPG